ncbi:MAG: Txe/YoeB family addiction module toxin [Candidatus Rhabdochlamydia sp.]
MFKVAFTLIGWSDYLYWQEHNARQVKRINRLIQDCSRTPYEGIGKPEALKFDMSGCWSRRIDQEHRLIYRVEVESDILQILSCRTHYEKG